MTTSNPRLRGNARLLALQVVAEARAEWGYTTDMLGRSFRTNRSLGSTERRLVSETVYGMVRWERRLEAILGEVLSRGRKKIEGLSPQTLAEVKLLVYELRFAGVPEAEVTADLQRLLRREPPVAELGAPDAGLDEREGLDRDAVRLSYPTWLMETFVADMGHEEALNLATAMNLRAPMAIRANTARIDRAGLQARLLAEGVQTHPTAISGEGLVLDTRINAFALPSFQEGLFEVMDEGSQLVAEMVAPPPGGRVLDACAGAGGKTLALGALLANKGKILALDVAGKKLEELRRRARRAGLSNVAAREIKENTLPGEAKPGVWDRVLVDAPCSGLGTLRRNPEARWRLTASTVATFPPRQIGLLVTYAPMVAPGGRLIYATCTVTASENERVVERFLAERPDFDLFPLKDIWSKERATRVGDGNTLRLYPHRHDTDGFFCAVLRKKKG